MSAMEDAAQQEVPVTPGARRKVLGQVADLLERNGIDVGDVGRVHRINVWQGFLKDENGEPRKVDMTGIQLSPQWAEGPAWPVVQPAKPVRPRSVTPRRRLAAHAGSQVTLVLPDPQIGYRRDLERPEVLDPFHDERAMDLALQVARDLQPDRIVNLGDLLDFPSFSRFVREPAFTLTVQPTLDRAHDFLAQQREIVPGAEIVLIEGNHDRRLANEIISNAKAAFGIRQAGTPEGWPVLSVQHLLRLDDLGVEYVDGYPAGIYWIADNVAAIHGERLKTPKVLDDEQVSVVHGHTHRIHVAHRRRRLRTGAEHTWAASPGCLCRVDGAVPSVHGSTDARGKAVRRDEDWQQGFSVVTTDPDGHAAIETAEIVDGVAYFRGTRYSSAA